MYAQIALAINVEEDDDIDIGMERGVERFKNLNLLEKYIIYRYDELTVASEELTVENEKLRKENAKLKKGKIF